MRLRFVVAVALGLGLAACGSPTRDPLATSVFPPPDAGGDGSVDASTDAGNLVGADGGLGSPCTDDPQCDDHVACSYDSCDPILRRCRNVPDDTQCQDISYCDGHEVCVPFHGCVAGPVLTCDDLDPCTIDRCVEAQQSCSHAPRDADGDQDPDDHCAPHHDCNDLDPAIASTHSEVCANLKDDNCNGQVDEQPCATPVASTCASALTITAAGTYALDTTAAPVTYPTKCNVTTPASAHQEVALVTIPAGPARDLQVWATAQNGEAAVEIQAACGDDKTEIGCGNGDGASGVRARGRSLAPGTYAVILTTSAEGPVQLEVDFLDATPTPTNDACALPLPITPDTAIDVALIEPSLRLSTKCGATVGELTYTFTLAAPADVRVFATTQRGSGLPVVSLRNAHCADPADELRCRTTTYLPIFVRNLPAGTYVVAVAATSSIDANVLLRTYPASVAPPQEQCATAAVLAPNTRVAVDLSNSEGAIDDKCFGVGAPNAAFSLPLAAASDVLVVGRFPQVEAGAVALDPVACTSSLVCTASGTPARASARNVPAGAHRVLVYDQIGAQNDAVTAYVRDTVAPTVVADADKCATAVDIPAQGGFFTGDTSTATPDFDDACDTTSPSGGAADQVLHLALAQPQHVVFDMSGSAYITILDVRQGATCPGTEVANQCYVGFTAQRSFLDIPAMAAGNYWIVVDGYASQKGAWNLDVRVLPP